MELLPAHQPLFEDDTDEELSDEQIRELLNEAAVRMRAKTASQPVTSDAPFKLPKLKPGHIADQYEKTDGNITRLDSSKLVDKEQQALANGIKKIDDPLHVQKLKKQEVRNRQSRSNTSLEVCYKTSPPVMITIPIFFTEQIRAPSWVSSCITEVL